MSLNMVGASFGDILSKGGAVLSAAGTAGATLAPTFASKKPDDTKKPDDKKDASKKDTGAKKDAGVPTNPQTPEEWDAYDAAQRKATADENKKITSSDSGSKGQGMATWKIGAITAGGLGLVGALILVLKRTVWK